MRSRDVLTKDQVWILWQVSSHMYNHGELYISMSGSYRQADLDTLVGLGAIVSVGEEVTPLGIALKYDITEVGHKMLLDWGDTRA